MPRVVLSSGQRREHHRVEIDVSGSSVVGMDDFAETERYPFFHVARVDFEDGVVFVEDSRE